MTSTSPLRLWAGLLAFGLALSTVGPAAEAAAPFAKLDTGASLDGSGWSAPENVSLSSLDSEAPALAVTDTGVAHLVWEEGDELYHSYRRAGYWSGAERISGTGDGEQPALAPGPGDTVHLVYINNSDVFYTSWDTSGWDIPQNLSQTTQVSDAPDIAVSPDGTIHVVAVEAVGKQLYCGQAACDSPWTYVPILHEFGFAYGESPSIDVLGTDTIQLTYSDEGQDIYFLERSDTSWSPPENISDSLEANSIAPDLAVDANGIQHVVWQEEVDGTPQIRYARGADWSPVATLSASAAGARLPAVTMEGAERQHVFWHDEGFPFTIRYASRLTSTSQWGPVSTVYTSSLSLDTVVASSGPGAVLHAAWVEGSTGEILYARRMPYRLFLPLVLATAH